MPSLLLCAALAFPLFAVSQPAPTTPSPEDTAAAAGCGIVGILGFGLLAIIGFIFYLIPSMIAFSRKHPNAPAILAVNLLLGWSFIGWVVALVWSLTAF